MKSGCTITKWMDYLWDAIFKMATIEITFSPTTVSRIDRDKILVSKSIFLWMRNPTITLKNPYMTLGKQGIPKWPPSKPAEITLISPWAQ